MADRSNKTEAPTPRRKREARKRGQVPRSPELVAWASVLLLTILVQSTFRRATTSLTALFDRAGFQYHGRVRSLAAAAREAGLDF